LSERDSQRKRLYKAEQATRVWHDEPIGPEFIIAMRAKLCSTFANEVLKRKYVQRKYPKAARGTVHVEISKGAYAFAKAHGGYLITLPGKGTWAYTKLVVLHELAHIIEHRENGHKNAAHDWQFAAIFLDLVRNVMGKETHDHLKRQFRLNRVRFKPKAKRTLTPEQREAARQRMAKARAVREANLTFKREVIAAFEPTFGGRWEPHIGRVKGVPVDRHPRDMDRTELAFLKTRIERYEKDRISEAVRVATQLTPEEQWRRDFKYQMMLDFRLRRPDNFIAITGI
jgi:putative metallohydrolase (TIGR04338 family)